MKIGQEYLDLSVLHDISTVMAKIMVFEGTTKHTSYLDESDGFDNIPNGHSIEITICKRVVPNSERE